MDHLKKGDPRIPQETPEAFINRKMSWLCFARRVLNLAEDPPVFKKTAEGAVNPYGGGEVGNPGIPFF